MCTAISINATNHYFGRNLDLNYSYRETVTVMPRDYPLQFRCTGSIKNHYAMIGMSTIDNGYPLFYDATNEYGLSVAALNFPENAVYLPTADSAVNIAPFELIPWILCQCKTVNEARNILKDVRIVNIQYSDAYALTPLHWIISDSQQSITVEPISSELMIYDNPIDVLTNNPQFPYHTENLRHYLNLTPNEPGNAYWNQNTPVSFGTGAIGLPGDFSSASRFVRAAFIKSNAVFGESENTDIMQFFHILQSVQQVKGAVRHDGQNHITVYSSCCDTTNGIYYYTTYNNCQITGINMYNTNLDGCELTVYPLRTNLQIIQEN